MRTLSIGLLKQHSRVGPIQSVKHSDGRGTALESVSFLITSFLEYSGG